MRFSSSFTAFGKSLATPQISWAVCLHEQRHLKKEQIPYQLRILRLGEHANHGASVYAPVYLPAHIPFRVAAQ
jgi:hypothetical protein